MVFFFLGAESARRSFCSELGGPATSRTGCVLLRPSFLSGLCGASEEEFVRRSFFPGLDTPLGSAGVGWELARRNFLSEVDGTVDSAGCVLALRNFLSDLLFGRSEYGSAGRGVRLVGIV